jgi:hypothetical protein
LLLPNKFQPAAMPSIYLFAGCIQCASPIKLPRFRKGKKSKTIITNHDESDLNLVAADQIRVRHPPFLQKNKTSLANVSWAGTNSTNSLTSSSSSESLAFRTIFSVNSEDSSLQLPDSASAPEIELLPAEPFYFQNMDLPPPAREDEWGYFVDFAT